MDSLLLPLWVILSGWMLAGGSPGPATLTISATSMEAGRRAGLLVAAGVVTGSATWGIAAALGFSAIMLANAWLFELLRYAGAAYLLYLAAKSLRTAWKNTYSTAPAEAPKALFRKGLLLHLTNPKAILSWGSIYAVAVAPTAPPQTVWLLFTALIYASMVVFFGYALLFAAPPIARGYRKLRRAFDTAFGLLFGAASLKIMTLKL